MSAPSASRRGFVKSAAGLAVAPSLAAIPSLAHAAGEVVVGTWGGDYQNLLQQNIGPIVEKEGIKVVFDTGSAVPRLTKLRAEVNSRRGSMDVALLGDLDMYDAAQAQALMPLTPKEVPNLSQAFEQFVTPYSIPHIFSAMVLVYNTEKFPKPPESLQAIYDPQNKGRFGMSDILFNFNGLFLGLAEGKKATSFEPGKKMLLELLAQQPKVFPSNEAVAAAFKSGEIWFSCMWKARALQWRNAGLPLSFVIPSEGGIPVTFEGAVARNARNSANGLKYLDAMLAPEGQVKFAQSMGYAPTVRNAQLPADLQASVGFSDAEVKRIHGYDMSALSKGKNDFLEFWNKEFKAKL